MTHRTDVLDHPRRLALVCAGAAICLGLGYMGVAGAPARYLAMNAAAFLLGLLIFAGVAAAPRALRAAPGAVALALSVVLVLVGLAGTNVDGATRWVAFGGLAVQPSLMVLPALALCFARGRDSIGVAAILIASLALAIQPDRAMAGALVAGMAGLALVRPERNVIVALIGASIGFAITLARADVQPAVPFVDRILYSSFDVHPLAGASVLAGVVLMLVPPVTGFRRKTDERELYVVFGAVWLAVIAAAALGNYPTPLVGYGGSAIIGYLVSITSLPRRPERATDGDPRRTALHQSAGADRNLSYSV